MINKTTLKSLSIFGHVDRLIIEKLAKSQEQTSSDLTICS